MERGKVELDSQSSCSKQLWNWRSSHRFIIISISIALFTDAFVYGVVVSFIPSLLHDQSHVPKHNIQEETSLVVAAFGILDFLGAPLCSLYVDNTSNRHVPFLGGIVIMASGTILFGIGTTRWFLFFGRLLQGFASALLYTVSLALLADTVPREEVGKWLGIALSCNNIGMVLSPLIGGVIYHKAGKYAVFGTMMGLIGIDAVSRMLMISAPRRTNRERILARKSRRDDTAANLDVVQSSAPDGVRISIRSSQESTDQPGPVSKVPIQRFPAILRLVQNPKLLAALYGIFLNECLNASLMAVMPIFVHETFGWNTLGAGLLFLTIAIPSIGGFAAGWLSDRFGPKLVATSGLLIAGPTVMLLSLVRRDSVQDIVLLCALLTITGIALNMFLVPLSADLSFVADEESRLQRESASIIDDGITDISLYAASYSLMNSAMAAATLFGPLFMGWLEQSCGWKVMTIVLGSILLSGTIPCICFTSNVIEQSQ